MITRSRTRPVGQIILSLLAILFLFATTAGAQAQAPAQAQAVKVNPSPKFSTAKAFDVSPAMRDLALRAPQVKADPQAEEREVRPDRGPEVLDDGFKGDGALNSASARSAQPGAAVIAPPLLTFEGLRNTDNPFLVNPPDPVGDVGPNHYVEMVNLVYAVYDKQGNRLVGPVPIGALWADFPITDCQVLSGDPIVLYDQTTDRWLLSQFTADGPEYWNCVAISTTGDPTGTYYRYAFSAGEFFPDYPKYGVWSNSYILTTREFGPTVEYRIGVYALEKNKMVNGEPKARAVAFYLDPDTDPAVTMNLIGDGLLPPDIDGNRRPVDGTPAPIVGTQDNDFPYYGATFDALNIFELAVQWSKNPTGSLTFKTQLPVAQFDSVFPCGPTARDCIPQPGVTDRNRYLDILSYRQRPTYRLAYRNFGTYEALVTNQSVEAAPGVAGVRWYEIRRTGGVKTPTAYTLAQQGTYAPGDGVHRWMGSVAMDRMGNIALGYSVSNATDVYPGIRYTGRLASDPLGAMGLIGEGTIIKGTGVMLTTNSRWGDYTSMNIDPVDDCTFWYVNEYVQTTGLAFWQTRIGSFRLPGCVPKN